MVGTVTIIVTPRLYKADITIHSSSYPFSSYTRTRYIGCNDLKKLVVNKIWHHCTGKKYQMEDTGKPNIHIYKILDHCRTFPFVQKILKTHVFNVHAKQGSTIWAEESEESEESEQFFKKNTPFFLFLFSLRLFFKHITIKCSSCI